MELNDEDIAHILKLVDESAFDEVEIEWKGLVIRVSRRSGSAGEGAASPVERAASRTKEAAPAPAPKPAPAARVSPAVPAGCIEVRAPVMGTFYRSPAPGQPPFVAVGSVVGKDDTLCLVEVMKVFTAVKAERGGVVEAVFVEDAQLIEFGQPLFAIRPGGS